MTVSSSSRSCLRLRSRPGAWRELPAPAGVPVERRVGIGLVRPRTLRPVSGVWSKVLSRPVPPTFARVLAVELRRARPEFCLVDAPRRAEVAFADLTGLLVFFDAFFFVARFTAGFRELALAAFRAGAAFRLPGRGGLVGCLRRALPCGVFAPAVFLLPPAVRAAARAPAPALRFDGVSFCPRDLPLDPDFLVLFFFAI